jgi:hypothetical protein
MAVSRNVRAGPLFLDTTRGELLLAETSGGKLYTVSISDGKAKLLADNLGWANAVIADDKHIAIASGKKILFLSRADFHGENPPTEIQTLTGGLVSGLAIDGSGRLWPLDLTPLPYYAYRKQHL